MTRQNANEIFEIGGTVAGAWLFWSLCYPTAAMPLWQHLPWVFSLAIFAALTARGLFWLAAWVWEKSAQQKGGPHSTDQRPVAHVGQIHPDSSDKQRRANAELD
ncbi:MAG: hypothetical protein Q8M09_12480 [Pseudomonadota bacterium]|nr:hypothetical protein [Pseudomonadota bacterium]MDP1905043.1 hypothetical protein [Pseudomonadota bacterium]MDP2354284.1 hypothetical protein [Pseudomonadota bacterium]